MAGPLTKEVMLRALGRLDELLPQSITLIVGGGSSMILAHNYPRGTTDIDSIPKGMSVNDLDPLIKKIAEEQNLPLDWMNPYFATFSHTLPSDYGNRLVEVYNGKQLKALALGKEEMLIMKCFAHRQKDVAHAKALIQAGADVKLVETHIESLVKKQIPQAQTALDFLDDVRDQL